MNFKITIPLEGGGMGRALVELRRKSDYCADPSVPNRPANFVRGIVAGCSTRKKQSCHVVRVSIWYVHNHRCPTRSTVAEFWPEPRWWGGMESEGTENDHSCARVGWGGWWRYRYMYLWKYQERLSFWQTPAFLQGAWWILPSWNPDEKGTRWCVLRVKWKWLKVIRGGACVDFDELKTGQRITCDVWLCWIWRVADVVQLQNQDFCFGYGAHSVKGRSRGVGVWFVYVNWLYLIS